VVFQLWTDAGLCAGEMSAEQHKLEGNKLYKAKDYLKAVKEYSKACKLVTIEQPLLTALQAPIHTAHSQSCTP
jgi:hypothetical protein